MEKGNTFRNIGQNNTNSFHFLITLAFSQRYVVSSSSLLPDNCNPMRYWKLASAIEGKTKKTYGAGVLISVGQSRQMCSSPPQVPVRIDSKFNTLQRGTHLHLFTCMSSWFQTSGALSMALKWVTRPVRSSITAINSSWRKVKNKTYRRMSSFIFQKVDDQFSFSIPWTDHRWCDKLEEQCL